MSKVRRNDRQYEDFSSKQKQKLAERQYSKYLRFYLTNQRMPNVVEAHEICMSLYKDVQALTPNSNYEEFEKVVLKRAKHYEGRILKDIENGVTIASLDRPSVKQRKKKRTKASLISEEISDQMMMNDSHFFVVGHTSNGIPYGIHLNEEDE